MHGPLNVKFVSFRVCCRHVLNFTREGETIIGSRTCKIMLSNKMHALDDVFH